MILTLIRHAKSSWSDLSLEDFDRPLNERGKSDAPKMAHWFSENIQETPILFSSPANRALSTAKCFEKELTRVNSFSKHFAVDKALLAGLEKRIGVS